MLYPLTWLTKCDESTFMELNKRVQFEIPKMLPTTRDT